MFPLTTLILLVEFLVALAVGGLLHLADTEALLGYGFDWVSEGKVVAYDSLLGLLSGKAGRSPLHDRRVSTIDNSSLAHTPVVLLGTDLGLFHLECPFHLDCPTLLLFLHSLLCLLILSLLVLLLFLHFLVPFCILLLFVGKLFRAMRTPVHNHSEPFITLLIIAVAVGDTYFREIIRHKVVILKEQRSDNFFRVTFVGNDTISKVIVEI